MSRVALIANAVLAGGVLAGYVVLTALNHDASALLGVLLGLLASVGATHAAETSRGTAG